MSNTNLCIDCNHFRIGYGPRGPNCFHPSNIVRSPVDGSISLKALPMHRRYPMASCGPSGLQWEPKPPKKPSIFKRMAEVLFWGDSNERPRTT
jgi:hypothetical protein